MWVCVCVLPCIGILDAVTTRGRVVVVVVVVVMMMMMMMMMMILHRLPYIGILGGVTAMKREQFYKINGYSNKYFGWGGEDDDLSGRWVMHTATVSDTVFNPLAIPRRNVTSPAGGSFTWQLSVTPCLTL